ncbi:MAG: peptidoglycan bridge formation glycyltransferase FemA/FemB family protein [Calothrix sp. C42_A2020_038]|nr:peptidoglycan bridge formation glycyltransferase FemA/FemB family protein [Calothrix sp. C42_A2020_038]
MLCSITPEIEVINASHDLWIYTLQKINHDFYHLPDYFRLEASRSNTIPESIIFRDGNKIFFAPYLLRDCNDICNKVTDFFDIVSPYGYPGILLSDSALKAPDFVKRAIMEFKYSLKEKGVCSAFFRLHPIINEKIIDVFPPNTFTNNGETVSIDLTLSEAQLWNHTKPDRRNKINKCKKNGLTARMVNLLDYIDDFIDIYEETMQRVGAIDVYYDFNQQYCVNLKKILGDKLHLCIVENREEILSAGLYAEYNGIVQALFGGTKTEYLKLSPSSLETNFVTLWAKERGNKLLHLGGGLGGTKNSLYEFKSGFSRMRHNFFTLRLIIDEEKYFYLASLKAKALNITVEKLLESQFFPAYRSSV